MPTAGDLVDGPFIVTESRLATDAEEVWGVVTTPAGVNAEFRPLMRMTVPRGWGEASLADVDDGTHIGRSWILLGGFLPFEYDDLTIVEVGPGRRFLEGSTMAMCRRWVHERTVEQAEGGCLLRDCVGFAHRRPFSWLPGSHRMQRAVIAAIFRYRHRRLASSFGVLEPTRQVQTRA